jgi:hypothetical protein
MMFNRPMAEPLSSDSTEACQVDFFAAVHLDRLEVGRGSRFLQRGLKADKKTHAAGNPALPACAGSEEPERILDLE